MACRDRMARWNLAHADEIGRREQCEINPLFLYKISKYFIFQARHAENIYIFSTRYALQEYTYEPTTFTFLCILLTHLDIRYFLPQQSLFVPIAHHRDIIGTQSSLRARFFN